jgi:inner membrane protein
VRVEKVASRTISVVPFFFTGNGRRVHDLGDLAAALECGTAVEWDRTVDVDAERLDPLLTRCASFALRNKALRNKALRRCSRHSGTYFAANFSSTTATVLLCRVARPGELSSRSQLPVHQGLSAAAATVALMPSPAGEFVCSPWLPTRLVLLVLALDAIQFSHPWSVTITGALDEPAHLATATLVLLAVAGVPTMVRHRLLVGSALLASVLIDADHIPLYAGASAIAHGGRPFGHSMVTVGALLLAGTVARERWRAVLLGGSLGVALHFIRDAATGPGLPLLWPTSTTNFRVPYPLYVGTLIVLGVAASLRANHDRRARRRSAGDPTTPSDREPTPSQDQAP